MSLRCYHPQTKLREGNVFTPGCHSVHRGGVRGGRACVAGGMCGRGGGVHGNGGMHGRGCVEGPCIAREHVWWGACVQQDGH